MSGIRRRELITLFGGAASWPFVARAEQSARPGIGLMHATIQGNDEFVAAFKDGLSQTGYVNGGNVSIEFRSAEGQYDQLPAIAAEFVQRQVNVIAAGTPVAALAAKRATTSIPIVFAVGSDPIRDGLVPNLIPPARNIPRATFSSNLLTGKRSGLLHDLVPNAKNFSALVNPKNANAQFQMEEADQAARALGRQIGFLNASTENDIEAAFDNLKQQRADEVLV